MQLLGYILKESLNTWDYESITLDIGRTTYRGIYMDVVPTSRISSRRDKN